MKVKHLHTHERADDNGGVTMKKRFLTAFLAVALGVVGLSGCMMEVEVEGDPSSQSPSSSQSETSSQKEESTVSSQEAVSSETTSTTTSQSTSSKENQPVSSATSSQSSTSSSGTTTAESVSLANIFGDHMVLQRNETVPIFGFGTPGAKVVVTFNGQTKTATVAADGGWRVDLDPMEANSKGKSLSVKSGKQTAGITDVLVGEVWLCSGQSNMEYRVAQVRATEKAEILEYCKNDQLRSYYHFPKQSGTPLKDVMKYEWCNGTENDKMLVQSAFGVSFGAKLQKELNVPVGIIAMTHGGTVLKSWLDSTHGNAHSNYNAMIAPIAPFRFAGILWYQGESDAISNANFATDYKPNFAYYCQSYRKLFEDANLPIFVVQIANFSNGNESRNWAAIRQIQVELMQENENVHTICGVDFGERGNIHPNDKLPFAIRSAEAALNKVYGKTSFAADSPILKSVAKSGNTLTLTFDHVADGLELKSGTTINDLYCAGADGKFVACTGTISGKDTVTVNCGSVSNPKYIRYEHVDAGNPNLYNSAGLPAFNFNVEVK